MISFIVAGFCGLLALGVGMAAATMIAVFGLRLTGRMSEVAGTALWMGYFSAVVAPSYAAALAGGGFVGLTVYGWLA